MKNINLAVHNLPTKILGCLLLLAGVLIAGWTAYAIFSFSAPQIFVLLGSLFISALLSQHQITVPSTKITLNAKDFAVIWGTLWLGIPGGVLLAASVAAVEYRQSPKDRVRCLFTGLISIISWFTAAGIVYFSLNRWAEFTENSVAGHQIGLGWLMLSVVALTILQRLF